MRSLTKLALGGTMASAATALGLLAGGVFAGSALVVAGPAPSANAEGLVPFDDCAALRDWYVTRAIKDVGPYGWGGPVIAYGGFNGTTARDMVVPQMTAPDAAAEPTGQANSATGTNTQEADVDEPDVAKTDGTLVVRIDGNTLVVTDVSGPDPVELGRLRLPGQELIGAELLLVGERAIVLAGEGHGTVRPMADGFGEPSDVMPGRSYAMMVPTDTMVLDVDLSDPAAPRLDRTDRYRGRLVSARLYGEDVRLVTATGRPDLAWTYPEKGISEDEATRRNRALVRATTVEDWLPTITTAGRTEQLLDCADVLHPRTWSGAETVTVTTFPAGDIGDRDAVGITGEGHVVYSSTDRLYVASTRMQDPDAWRRLAGRLVGDDVMPAVIAHKTDLHAFALDGRTTSYIASGTLEGTVRDRWSLDEDDGVLRVAWTRYSDQGRTRNGITTLVERGADLVRAGEVDDLGIDEDIQSVRWFDDLAVVVTFRQIDPLYTIDLSDPARPRELGALKVPGYSGYLHPLGDDRLLGLGVDATLQGESRGAQAATFDVADLRDPRRTDRLGFGRSTDLTAIADPRGFTWLPDLRTGVTAVSDWNTGRTRLVTLEVDTSGGLESRVLARDLQGWQTRVLPLSDGRIAVVDPGLPTGLRVLDLG